MEAVLVAAFLIPWALFAHWIYKQQRGRDQTALQIEDALRRVLHDEIASFVFSRPSSREVEAKSRELTLSVRVGVETVSEENEKGEVGLVTRQNLRTTLVAAGLPQLLRFSRERGFGDDVLTGDSRFDDAVDVRGEPSIILALLDKRVRDKLRQFVELGGSLEDGRLVASLPFQSEFEIPHAAGLTLEVARLLSSLEGGSLCERLARNAAADPDPGVRLWTLLQLQEQFGLTPEAGKASRAGLGDTSPWVRLSAARFLRDEGLEVLRALAQDRQVPDDAASEAVALLAARLSTGEAGPLLLSVLKHRSGETGRQAVEQLGRLKHLPAVGPLIVVLERSNPRTAAAAATALGTIGDSSAEPALLKAVSDDARELRLAAARALGALGTVRAVEPLLALVEGKRLDAENRQGLREAVSAIQSRLAGAGAGQLSLASEPAESGRLSLATPTAGPGDLSFVPDPK
jgi:HEAT repeat protein